MSLGTTVDILDIQQTTSEERWLTGRSGFVAQSSNLRTTWTTVDVGTTADLYSVVEPAVDQVWVGAGTGRVRHKFGSEWKNRDIPDSQDFVLYSRLVGGATALGSQGAIYRSTDYGETWMAQPSGTTVALRAGGGISTGPAWAVGDEGTILKFEGGSWSPQTSGTTADLHGFVENLYMQFAVGENGTILKSTNGGLEWIAKESGTFATLRDISVSKNDFNVMVAAGDEGIVLASTDRGDTWCHLPTGTNTRFYAVEAVSTTEILVAGENGLLLRTTTGGGGCADPAEIWGQTGAQTHLRLSAPSPSPAAHWVDFRLEHVNAEFITRVFDPQGRRIAVPIENRGGGVGFQDLRLDLREVPAGIYFVAVTSGGETTTRRIALVR